ncbi:MAG: 6-phosphofructokinase [Clostridia bacterium]|nr:6-phosphofructokinase [Clostridia bacterium]
MLKGACVFGQSGGPTSVINASAYGVFTEALKSDCITAVYGAANGIKGILEDRLYDIGQEDPAELELLKTTPSSALGSCRYKLKDASVDDTDYKRILEIFKKYDIRYFFYNGGNDSMDTCNKVSKYLLSQGYECKVIGVPKTIDNDLAGIDHCPGYGSAAKYIATAASEIWLDAHVYDTSGVTILECMGRNAGWLTAAAALAARTGYPADLIYLPERAFDLDDFTARVKACVEKTGGCLAVISEGIHDKDGKFIAEYAANVATDAFGHKQMGGAAAFLASHIKSALGGIKTRPIEFSLLQRCAAHCASATDVEEAVRLGQFAVQSAVAGETDQMAALIRLSGEGYQTELKLLPLTTVANAEKKFPQEWITEDGTGIKQEFFDYALPLIQGEPDYKWENGMPRLAKLKKVQVK